MLSVPNGRALAEALPGLDLFVSLDLYVNETDKEADYILPTTTWLEREDVPVAFLPFFTQPFAQWTDPVLEPYGEARPEWQIIEDLAHGPASRCSPPPGCCRRGWCPTRWAG